MVFQSEINIIDPKYLTMDETIEQMINVLPNNEEVNALTLN